MISHLAKCNQSVIVDLGGVGKCGKDEREEIFGSRACYIYGRSSNVYDYSIPQKPWAFSQLQWLNVSTHSATFRFLCDYSHGDMDARREAFALNKHTKTHKSKYRDLYITQYIASFSRPVPKNMLYFTSPFLHFILFDELFAHTWQCKWFWSDCCCCVSGRFCLCLFLQMRIVFPERDDDVWALIQQLDNLHFGLTLQQRR